MQHYTRFVINWADTLRQKAQALLATLWKAADAFAAQLMHDFYAVPCLDPAAAMMDGRCRALPSLLRAGR